MNRQTKMNRQIGLLTASLLTGLITSAVAQQTAPQTDQQAVREIEAQFIAAFNRQDSAALAALFSEDGIRVTPGGFIQGRDAIRKDFDKRFQSHFHDLAVTMQVTKSLSGSIWGAGEWTMKIGEQSIRGYGAMTLIREGSSFKIRDDTFNVAPPASPGPQPASK
jgi:ketosteroid isomerase-like protein